MGCRCLIKCEAPGLLRAGCRGVLVSPGQRHARAAGLHRDKDSKHSSSNNYESFLRE